MTRRHTICQKYWPSAVFLCLLIGLVAGVPGSWISDAGAKTIYSYLDDKGDLVYTDAPETIPERYRAKVKTHEQRMLDDAPASVSQLIQRRLRAQIRDVRSALPAFHTGIYGLTPRQSEILTYGGLAAIVLLLMMYIGKSPFTRLLGLALLMVLGIGLPVLMYIGDNGPLDRIQKHTAASRQTQQDRLQPPAR
jgi:hypothetical protein